MSSLRMCLDQLKDAHEGSPVRRDAAGVPVPLTAVTTAPIANNLAKNASIPTHIFRTRFISTAAAGLDVTGLAARS